ncbi:hypothetical protein [Bradyrhizobium sp. USDA 10063]
MSDDNIKPLPVKFKAPPSEEGPMLKVIDLRFGENGCNHRYFYRDGRMQHVGYLIREGETEVECGHCHTRLDPMFVLRMMATEETQWLRTRKAYVEEMQRLNERRRTKCDHCGQMTRISK